MSQGHNPLTQYYRGIITQTKLPSGTTYYKNGEVEFSDDGELGIKAMTGQDEITMKNPDALLSGSAITDVIRSCVDGVKNPKLLLANDIDVLMVAIRAATHGETMDVSTKCPACGHDNEYEVNLNHLLATVEMLDDDYPVNLESGLTVFVQPFTYQDTLKTVKVQFEQSKLMKAMENDNITEERRLQLFSQSFNSLSALNSELVVSSIKRVEDSKNNINVSDPAHIAEFLKNIDTTSFDMIEAESRRVNSIGIQRELKAVCRNEECKHEWSAPIDFNPVNFSMGS